MTLSVEGISTGSTLWSRYGFEDVCIPNEGLLHAAKVIALDVVCTSGWDAVRPTRLCSHQSEIT